MLLSFSTLLGFLLHLLTGRVQGLYRFPHRRGHDLLLALGSAALLFALYRKSPALWFVVNALLSMLTLHIAPTLTQASAIAEALLLSPERAQRSLDAFASHRTPAQLTHPDLIRETICVLCARLIDDAAVPILCMLIGGAPLALLCCGLCASANAAAQAAPTRTMRFIRFFPARLCAFFMVLVCGMLRYDYQNGRRIYQRDRRNQIDPEVGQILSVCAGALHLRLPGKNGLIGNVDRPVVRTDILRMCDLCLFCTWLFLLTGCFFRTLFFSIEGLFV